MLTFAPQVAAYVECLRQRVQFQLAAPDHQIKLLWIKLQVVYALAYQGKESSHSDLS